MSTATITKSKTESTFFVVEADCMDEGKNPVVRHLGRVHGMSDIYPAWSAWATTKFGTLEEARAAASHPYSLNAFDSHYDGGEIRISKVMENIVKITTSELMPLTA